MLNENGQFDEHTSEAFHNLRVRGSAVFVSGARLWRVSSTRAATSSDAAAGYGGLLYIQNTAGPDAGLAASMLPSCHYSYKI